MQFFINTHLKETFFYHLFKEFPIVTFSVSDQGGEDVYALTCILLLNHVSQLFLSIFHHLLTCSPAVGCSCTGKEKTKVVVHLCGGAHSRTGILVGGLLFDGDDWRKSCYLVNIRTLHTPKKIPGVGREGLNIPALTLSQYGVESQ